jgi:hypothetical protein
MAEQQQIEIKKGIYSSEFWVNVVAMLAGIVMASGAIPEGGVVAQIVGGVMMAISSASYTAGRSILKKHVIDKE